MSEPMQFAVMARFDEDAIPAMAAYSGANRGEIAELVQGAQGLG